MCMSHSAGFGLELNITQARGTTVYALFASAIVRETTVVLVIAVIWHNTIAET